MDLEKEIRETWFEKHVATLETHGDLKVLKWKEPGTSMYCIRFIFDGSRMYVTGDVGDAVFCFTEKSAVEIQSGYGLDYFNGKLEAFSDSRVDFNTKKAIERLIEWRDELDGNERDYPKGKMSSLIAECRDCSHKEHWAQIVNDSENGWIGQVDCDFWEWLYNIGDEIPARIQSFLIALKMANEQLNKKREKGGE